LVSDSSAVLPVADAKMVSRISEVFEQTALAGGHLFLAMLSLLVALLISLAIPLAILIRVSPDYLVVARTHDVRDVRQGVLSWAGIILKNLLGAMLVVLGAILSLPGIPGQGLLTVVAGVLLLDFPGKRRLLLKMLSRPLLLRSINRLRTKFSRPPLLVG